MSSSPALDSFSSQLLALSKTATETFHKIPGSPILTRYISSSYQNDPFRSLLELFLLAFAIRTIAQSRTRASASGSNFVKLDTKEIDDLVAEFNPAPLCEPLSETEQKALTSVPTIIGGNSPHPKVSIGGGKVKEVINLASYNFADLAGDERVKSAAIQTLRTYGVGSCSPPGFYGTIDVHVALESEIARFLGSEAAIIYSQGFSTISSVIPAFSKRGDIIVADKGVNFAIQKGISISRSTVRYYDHNDLDALEATLKSVVAQYKRKKPLTRRFIITEGVFENDGQISNLRRLIELKKKYKFRLILDESLSVGTVGSTGRGMTELFNVPATEVDMIIGSMANTLGAAGGFCAGSNEVIFHQRINGPAFVYSAALPAMLAVAASVAIIKISRNQDDVLSRLRDNIKATRAVLDRIECLYIPSHAESPVIHVQVRSKFARHPDTSSSKAGGAQTSSGTGTIGDPTHDLAHEDQLALLDAIVADALESGVFLSTRKKLALTLSAHQQPAASSVSKSDAAMLALDRGAGARPSIRIAVTAGLSRKEIERAANVVKASAVKVLGKRRI
ncbi:unnamed protein product [Parajaminaea phylloscopi]